MVSINEIRNDMMLDELNECLDKCKKCSAYITLKQVTASINGDIGYTDVSEMTVDVEALPNIYNGVIFLRLITTGNDSEIELKKIYSLWETLLERSTELARQNRKNDYIMTVDLVNLEGEDTVEATAYTMSYRMPTRIYPEYPEYGSLMLEFNSENMRFEKANIDMVEVNDELDYTEEVNKQNARQESRNDEPLGEDAPDESSEFIGNSSYLL
jgi:hypothetical protein